MNRDRVVRVGRLRLMVRERGLGHPLLLINGLGGNVDMWGVAQERLAEQAHTIAFDAPGTGRSQVSPVPLPMPAFARTIVGLLDELGHERVDVLGYSWGGLAAQQLARTAPGRVRRLALAGTSCGWGSVPGDLRAIALLATPLRYYSKTFYARTSHLLDGVHDPNDRDGHSLEHAEARRRHPPTLMGYTQQLVIGSAWTSLPWLHEVQSPTLVISGQCDRLVPPVNAMQLAGQLPMSRLHRLPGEGHLLLFDPKSAALPLLGDFFAAERLDDSSAWRGGEEVRDDAVLEEAIRQSPGGQPYKAIGTTFRRLLGAVR
jgi:pimeloyl-ACP methyl ester carboxylesterase